MSTSRVVNECVVNILCQVLLGKKHKQLRIVFHWRSSAPVMRWTMQHKELTAAVPEKPSELVDSAKRGELPWKLIKLDYARCCALRARDFMHVPFADMIQVFSNQGGSFLDAQM